MHSPDTRTRTLQLLLDVFRVCLEIVANKRCQLGGTGLGSCWEGGSAPAKPNDGRDGWVGKRLADELTAHKAGRAADYNFHAGEVASAWKTMKVVTSKAGTLLV